MPILIRKKDFANVQEIAGNYVFGHWIVFLHLFYVCFDPKVSVLKQFMSLMRIMAYLCYKKYYQWDLAFITRINWLFLA
jgi:hypothetical protein